MSNKKSTNKARTRLLYGSALTVSTASIALQLMPLAGLSAQRDDDPSPHSDAELISEVAATRPGEPFTVALRISLDPGWHSYWQNPGDAGQPASIEWRIPAGYRAGAIEWPYPHKVEESTVVSYGYDDEVMLLTQIMPPRFLTIGQTVKFAARAHWLVCNNICLPATAALEFEIEISEQAVPPTPRWRGAFEETRRRLPVSVSTWEMSASRTAEGFTLEIVPDGVPPSSFDGAFFYVSERGVLAHGAPQVVSLANGRVSLSLTRSPYARTEPDRLVGVLVMPVSVELEEGMTRAIVVDVPVAGALQD